MTKKTHNGCCTSLPQYVCGVDTGSASVFVLALPQRRRRPRWEGSCLLNRALVFILPG